MKKILALLAVVLGVVSCQTEPEGLDVNVGGEQEVAICVSLPEATRANVDSALGAFANVDLGTEDDNNTIRYILKIYQLVDGEYVASNDRQVEYSDGQSVVFPVRLVPNRDYRFVVWADYVERKDDTDLHYNTRDLANITLNGEWNPMDETRDAFTGYFDTAKEGEQYTSTSSINITLKRPFAKLRVITTDMKELGYLGINPAYATVEYATEYRAGFNAFESKAFGAGSEKKSHSTVFPIKGYSDFVGTTKEETHKVLFTDYFFAEDDVVKFTLSVYEDEAKTKPIKSNFFNTDIAAKRNYLTTIQGNILTDGRDVTVTVEDAFEGNVDYDSDKGEQTTTVNTAADFAEAFTKENIDVIVLNGDINLDDLLTRATYTALTVKNGKTLTIDLNDNKLSANTYENSGNHELFLVKGTLSVKNGTIEYKHLGENMGWGSMTTIFDVTAGGVLNLEGVTAKNFGGSDMNFVAHLNNWGEVTLNVENSTLESNYVPVRVFNSGNDMNNVTIKNSTLTGVSAAFWVHNYTVADFGTEEKAEAQKALLNFDIYNGTNTFSPDLNGIRYGFTNAVRADAYGITKVVSEDGTEVVLGSMTDDGLVRRGVAGTEENTTITKAVVGEGITTLYDRTFRRFYALETVVLPSTLTTIGAAGSGVFQSCTALKEIVIPESVTVLGKGSFQECSSLESINIPAGVTRIEADALRATGLVSVEFHEGVTYFGAQAFRDCKQLTEVVINAPEFTMEGNTFGISAAPYTPMTIYVANAEMKAYVESMLTAHAKTYITVVAPDSVSTAEELTEALANRENVVLTQDVTTEAATTAPYGNKYAFKLDGGVIDGNGHELHMECYGDDYGIMTSGGTIKNVTIKEGCRAVMIMSPQTDVILDNVKIGGDGVLYPINTGEAGAEGVNLVVTNSVLAGWTSYGLIESATFTNVEFKQGTYYNDIHGRVLKPYVNTTLTNCSFVEHMNLDLSSLGRGHKIVMKNCTVNGKAVTAATFTVPTTNAQYDTELFTIDLPSWASSINDCVVFE